MRRAFYMAALVASRHNPIIDAFYQRLRTVGKPASIALTAAMRKLLIHLNSLLKLLPPFPRLMKTVAQPLPAKAGRMGWDGKSLGRLEAA